MAFNKFDKGRGGRGGFGGGRGGFGGGRSFGDRNDGPKQMHQATCSQCGQSCEVPFRPSGDRPVFCNNCFKSQGGASSRPSFGGSKNFGGNRQASFGGNRDSRPASSGVTTAQIDSLNFKLDKILSMLTTAKIAEESQVAEPEVKEKKEKKPAKKAKAKKK